MPSVVVEDDVLSMTSNGRNMARDSTGRLWCVYEKSDGTYDQIYAEYSDDEGLTWTQEQLSSGTVDEEFAAIAIDSQDNVHVVWRKRTSPARIRYRKRTASGWGTQEIVSDEYNTDDHTEPSIAIDSQDNVHVAWRGIDVHGGVLRNYWNVLYRKRTATAWGTTELVTDVDANQFLPAIAIDSGDNIHVVWRGTSVGGTNDTVLNVHYRKRTTSWQTIEHVSDSASAQTWATPSIAIDSADNVHVVWAGLGWGTETAYQNVQWRLRTDSWQAQEGVTDKDAHQWQERVAIDASDDVHVAWAGEGWGDNPTVRSIQYRKRNGSWGTQADLVNRAQAQYGPGLCWALWPRVSGRRVSRPKTGYCFLWLGQDATNYNAEYFYSSDLAWDTPGMVGLNPALMEIVLG